MITFPFGQNGSLIVIDPNNIAKIKAGQPLIVGDHIVCFTPDSEKFLEALGIKYREVAPNERVEYTVSIPRERLIQALIACQHLSEVLR